MVGTVAPIDITGEPIDITGDKKREIA